jgi:hypothetical protein
VGDKKRQRHHQGDVKKMLIDENFVSFIIRQGDFIGIAGRKYKIAL